MVREYTAVVLSRPFVVICYGSHRKLTRHPWMAQPALTGSESPITGGGEAVGEGTLTGDAHGGLWGSRLLTAECASRAVHALSGPEILMFQSRRAKGGLLVTNPRGQEGRRQFSACAGNSRAFALSSTVLLMCSDQRH